MSDKTKLEVSESFSVLPSPCVPTYKTSKTVVRIETSYWRDKSGAYMKRSIKVLKRKSFGYNLLLARGGSNVAEVVGYIVNFNEVADGVYELLVCNVIRNCESGVLDDWDLKLVPFHD